jgi:hypothetical protein
MKKKIKKLNLLFIVCNCFITIKAQERDFRLLLFFYILFNVKRIVQKKISKAVFFQWKIY